MIAVFCGSSRGRIACKGIIVSGVRLLHHDERNVMIRKEKSLWKPLPLWRADASVNTTGLPYR